MLLPHAAGVFHNLKTVMLCILCSLLGYSLKMGLSGIIVYYMVSLDIPLIWACHILCMVLSDHTSLTNLFISHLAHQVLDRVLSDLAHVHNILISYILCIFI